MFDNVINLNKYIKPKVVEGFLASGGNTTNIKDSTKVTKNFENNQKINRSMMVESITKLVNNVSSDVIQKNSSTAASAAGASNTLWLSNINCDDVVISGVRQGAQSTNQTLVKSSQTNMSKISNDISTSIDKTIEKVGGTDLAALQAENTKQLNDFMKEMPGYDPNKAQKLASKCPSGGGSLVSAGNKCNVSSSYELDASVKQALDLDESFKIDDQDDISNDIKSKLEQANFASCQASATADNKIMLQDITCASMSAATKAQKVQDAADKGETLSSSKRGRLEISDIEQQAVAKLYMTCIFDQKNVSEIANKITNSISKKYNQIYDAVNKKGQEKGQDWLDKKMKIVDAFAAAGVEQIMAAAGDLPPATPGSSGSLTQTPDSGKTQNKTTENKSDGSSSGGPVTDALPKIGPGPASDPNGIQFSKPASVPTDSLMNSTSKPQQGPPILPSSSQSAAKPAQSSTPSSASSTDTKPADSTSSTQSDKSSGLNSLTSNPYILYGGIGLVVIIIFLIIVFATSGSSNNDSDN